MAAVASALAMNEQALYVGSPRASGGRVFDYTLTDLSLFDTLADPNTASNPSFGTSMALEKGVLVVGAPSTVVANTQSPESSPESSIESSGDSTTEAIGSGAIGVFAVKSQSGFRQKSSLLFQQFASATEGYGRAVDIDKGRIVVGAPETDGGKGAFESVAQTAYSSELSGLWYDPVFNGEGFNVVAADVGIVVFFYGYSSNGDRLWLASETVTGEFRFGEDIHVPVFKAVKGEFDLPGSPGEALVTYGLLSMNFGSLDSATFTINGFDGNKISRSTFLADSAAYGGAYSGLWYEPAMAGEGYNVTVGKTGTIIFYYGSTNDGERLWLISDVMPDTIVDGGTFSGKMYETDGGDFHHPANPVTKLQDWGTIDVRFDSCTKGLFTLSGSDGNKTSDVVKLAGIDGAGCG